jgi:hypothetical protein
MITPTIIISDHCGGFAVAPSPAIPDRPDLTAFAADHRVALEFARAMAVAPGWPVVDQSSENGGAS